MEISDWKCGKKYEGGSLEVGTKTIPRHTINTDVKFASLSFSYSAISPEHQQAY